MLPFCHGCGELPDWKCELQYAVLVTTRTDVGKRETYRLAPSDVNFYSDNKGRFAEPAIRAGKLERRPERSHDAEETRNAYATLRYRTRPFTDRVNASLSVWLLRR